MHANKNKIDFNSMPRIKPRCGPADKLPLSQPECVVGTILQEISAFDLDPLRQHFCLFWNHHLKHAIFGSRGDTISIDSIRHTKAP